MKSYKILMFFKPDDQSENRASLEFRYFRMNRSKMKK